jgi:hypothetical protein
MPAWRPGWTPRSGSWVRPVTCRARASGSTPRSAASARQRSYSVSGRSCCLGLRVAWTAHLTSLVSAPAPRPPGVRPPDRSDPSVWRIPAAAPRARRPAHGCHRRPPPATRPRATWTARAGSWRGRWHRRPADAGTHPGRPAPVRAPCPVGHHQVGVQQRVALPGRPVVEPDRKQPSSGYVLDAGVAAAHPNVGVQVGLLAAVGASKRTRGALPSLDDYGSSVEREAHSQVLWRVHMRAVLWWSRVVLDMHWMAAWTGL